MIKADKSFIDLVVWFRIYHIETIKIYIDPKVVFVAIFVFFM